LTEGVVDSRGESRGPMTKLSIVSGGRLSTSLKSLEKRLEKEEFD
jgi:hypothetical protein